MDNHPQPQRQAAADAFMESLAQLADCFEAAAFGAGAEVEIQRAQDCAQDSLADLEQTDIQPDLQQLIGHEPTD